MSDKCYGLCLNFDSINEKSRILSTPLDNHTMYIWTNGSYLLAMTGKLSHILKKKGIFDNQEQKIEMQDVSEVFTKDSASLDSEGNQFAINSFVLQAYTSLYLTMS